ncbi:MAG: GNAT family N-acetyltransferase [Limimaricola sp.]|uniref:GNAT family N-acetyltransferase n=1 Tax=Limimaricola sp. TaxID=2211665 RepID=UPI001DB98C72|nr:GNAT family N-acetyltransferase [Limimaricola sp.]MBI1418803.1 GNAT family N-acetyltransferase [Limimaricola sp.]
MKIVPASAADIAPVAALWHDGWHEAHAAIVPPELVALRVPAEFQDRTAAHIGQTHVGLIDGELVGFVTVEDDEIYQLFVAPAARGTGAARALIVHGEGLIAKHHDRAWLACTVGNSRAAHFYQKSGWTLAGEEDLLVETGDGPFPVRVWRYEKALK